MHYRGRCTHAFHHCPPRPHRCPPPCRPVLDAARLVCAGKVGGVDESVRTNPPLVSPLPTGTPNTEQRFTVAAFQAQRRESGKIQYLVEWAGFHLVVLRQPTPGSTRQP